MKKIAQHKLLVAGESFDNCCRQVRKFFDLTSLVIYDCIQVIDEKCRSGLDADFFDAIAAAESKNRETVNTLVDELQQTGTRTISDLRRLEHGYPSKVLHVITHFLDGFIGIDSHFYNLLDDSHWLPTGTLETITSHKGDYWLIHIDCYSATPEEAGLLHM
jgi:hypothetical protein